jgi:cell shape-determining protein MreD
MAHCLNICIGLFLIVVQTTVMPHIPVFERFYDLLTPLVVYLSIFRPVREGTVTILIFGFLMDNISGGPFGLYLTAYFWLFLGVRWAITFLHVGDSFLLPFVVAVGVLMENMIFLGANAMFDQNLQIAQTMVNTVVVQVLWAVLTGPFFLMLFNYSHRRWDRWTQKIFAQKN